MLRFSLLLITFTFGMSLSHAQKVKANPLFNESEIEQIKKSISKENLEKLNKKSGLDAANDVYFKTVTSIAKKSKALRAGKNGYKLTATADRDLLIYVVQITQFFTEEIDGGLIHYYGFSLLHKALPADLDWAIDKSSLSNTNKEMMRDALKAQ